ncbi:hypothetical protein [Streptomyces sp. NPDC001070]
MRKHSEADQQEGLLAGTGTTGTRIIGRPLTTVEESVNEHRSQFGLDCAKAA